MSKQVFSISDTVVVPGSESVLVDSCCPEEMSRALEDSCAMNDFVAADSIAIASAWTLISETGLLIITEDGKMINVYLYG